MMSTTDHYNVLVIGSGEAGKYLAWTLSAKGHRTALIERKMIGGSCPNVACLPSKNIIHSAKVASFASRAAAFGVQVDSVAIDMPGVRRRKQNMVDELVKVHSTRYDASGVDLVMGEARFVGPKRSPSGSTTEGRERLRASALS
jgi:pyruvate/2-oxoglutarate dehydrogenase complex dihydrolipoamide dehydrogenase (E3) component